MPRRARFVVPEIPYHVTQRGNRRQPVFFDDGDYRLYRHLVGEAARRCGTRIWAYCLMPNHVHLIAVPSNADGLRRTFADAHRRYTSFVNGREQWTGHLWQGRFAAVAMDESHLSAAARYIAFNPVRAGLVARVEEWRWSSVAAHLAGQDDALVEVAPLLERYGDMAGFLAAGEDRIASEALRQAEHGGWPVGDDAFLARVQVLGGGLRIERQKPGPKPRGE